MATDRTLAERAVACLGITPPIHMSPSPYFDDAGWRWLPGLGAAPARPLCVEGVERLHRTGWLGWRLDLDDDGNKGRLLGVVRKAYGDPGACVVSGLRDGVLRTWRVSGRKIGFPLPEGDTEAKTLVAALECAP